MSTRMIVRKQLDKVLEDSISQQRRLVLTHNTPEGWRIFKSHFVSGSASSQMVLVASPSPRDDTISRPLEAGDTLGVTFRMGHKKCMFGTTLESNAADSTKEVVTLRWPEQIQQLQRRAYERAVPPKDQIIPVRFWRDDEASSTPLEARTVRHGQLENMSAGGIRIKVANPTDIQIGATYRCVFSPRPGKPSLVVDAIVRHQEAAAQGRASIGFQLVGLETTAEGHRVLERLARTVSQFQRARCRVTR